MTRRLRIVSTPPPVVPDPGHVVVDVEAVTAMLYPATAAAIDVAVVARVVDAMLRAALLGGVPVHLCAVAAPDTQVAEWARVGRFCGAEVVVDGDGHHPTVGG